MRLAFVGDIALGDHPKTVGFGVHSRYPHGVPLSLANRVRPPGVRPDLLFGNLEFPLGAERASARDITARQCRGSDQHAVFVAAAGESVLSVANKPSAQHGHDAFRETTEVLRESGIRVAGTSSDFEGGATIGRDGTRIIFPAWSNRPRQYA